MKKSLLALLLVFGLTITGAFAQEQAEQTTEEYGGELSYRNVVVYKVFDHKDVVIVIYAKHGKDMAQVMIPKSWTHENPRKLTYRTCPPGINPYMTVLTKNGEFHKVILTLPHVTSPDSLWTVASPHLDIGDSASAETLELDY